MFITQEKGFDNPDQDADTIFKMLHDLNLKTYEQIDGNEIKLSSDYQIKPQDETALHKNNNSKISFKDEINLVKKLDDLSLKSGLSNVDQSLSNFDLNNIKSDKSGIKIVIDEEKKFNKCILFKQSCSVCKRFFEEYETFFKITSQNPSINELTLDKTCLKCFYCLKRIKNIFVQEKNFQMKRTRSLNFNLNFSHPLCYLDKFLARNTDAVLNCHLCKLEIQNGLILVIDQFMYHSQCVNCKVCQQNLMNAKRVKALGCTFWCENC